MNLSALHTWIETAGYLAGQWSFRGRGWSSALPSIQVNWAAAAGLVMLLVGGALLILWLIVRSFRAPEEVAVEAVADVAEMPELPDLKTISRADAMRIRPDFFARRVSESLSGDLAFAPSVDDLLRRFLLKASFHCEGTLTLFLRDEDGRFLPRARGVGKVLVSGDLLRAVPAGHVGISGASTLASGKPVMSPDGRQAALPIESPTELTGYLLLESDVPETTERAISPLYDLCSQISVILYERIQRDLADADTGTSGRLRMEADLAKLCRAGGPFSFCIVEFAGAAPAIDGPSVYRDGSRIFILGPVQQEAALDAQFARIARVSPVCVGIAVTSGGEDPVRVFQRALRALDSAKSAGPNHYRILQAA